MSPNDLPGKTITCIRCGADFEFSAPEADFYQRKGLAEPRRCKVCRAFARTRNANLNREREHPACGTSMGDILRKNLGGA